MTTIPTQQYKYQITASISDPQNNQEIARTGNFLPDCLAAHYGFKDQIGDSGPTMHAEIACLARLPIGISSKGKVLSVTDPLCPNCMKSVIAAGVQEIRIDHKGFDEGIWYNSTDEAGIARRRYFDDVSLVMAQAAGIHVVKLDKDNSPVVLSPSNTAPLSDEHLFVEPYNGKIAIQEAQQGDVSFACSIVHNRQDDRFSIIANESYTPGMDDQIAENIRAGFASSGHDLRYRLMIDPLTHLLAGLSKYGLHLVKKRVYVSEIPTSRCIINAIGAGVTGFIFPKSLALATNLRSEKSKTAYAALQELQSKSIISVDFIEAEKINDFLYI